jgi:hypothetical protein
MSGPAPASRKRPLSMGDASTSIGAREIQPRPARPATFVTVNGQEQVSASFAPSNPNEPPRKKRGRPSKAEHERRVAEAAERGEIYPKPKKAKPLRPSAGEAGAAPPGEASGSRQPSQRAGAAPPTAPMFPSTPAHGVSPGSASSAPGKKRAQATPAGRAQQEAGQGDQMDIQASGHHPGAQSTEGIRSDSSAERDPTRVASTHPTQKAGTGSKDAPLPTESSRTAPADAKGQGQQHGRQ